MVGRERKGTDEGEGRRKVGRAVPVAADGGRGRTTKERMACMTQGSGAGEA